MSIISLTDTPRFEVGATFTLPRSSLSRNPETVSATVTRVRRGGADFIYTLAVDSHNKYPHWRVVSEGMLKSAVNEAAARLALVA